MIMCARPRPFHKTMAFAYVLSAIRNFPSMLGHWIEGPPVSATSKRKIGAQMYCARAIQDEEGGSLLLPSIVRSTTWAVPTPNCPIESWVYCRM